MTDTAAAHERYEEWDAGYVLGALSPAERREFETHLADCERCQAAVAELAAMPGLLSRLPADDAFALLDEVPTSPSSETAALDAGSPHALTASLARSVARRRRRTRGWTVTALAAAAAIALAAFVVPPVLANAGHPRPDLTVALAQDVAGPLSATVALTAHGWGTSIDMDCSYRSGTAGYGAGRYALYVTDAEGVVTRVTSWSAKPGDDVTLTAATAVPEQDIRTIELRDESTGAVLLSSKL